MCTSDFKAAKGTPPLHYLQEIEKLSAPLLFPSPPWIRRGENMSISLAAIAIIAIAMLAVLGI